MAFRFSRSLKIAPGVRLNFGKTGMSMTAGPRGASVTVGPRGTYTNVGIPGTGLSYRTKIDGGQGGVRQQQRSEREYQRQQQAAYRQQALADVKLHLDKNSGAVTIFDAFGNPLSRGDLKLLYDQNGDVVQNWLEQQAFEINGDIELLQKIHEDTQSPYSKLFYEAAPFDELPPEEPMQPIKNTVPPMEILPPLGFFANLFKSKRDTHIARQEQLQLDYKKCLRFIDEQHNAELKKYETEISKYKAAFTEWKVRKSQHESKEDQKSNDFVVMIRSDIAFMEKALAESLDTLVWPRETAISFQIGDDGRIVWLDVDLPEIEDLPIRMATLHSTGKKLNIKDKSQKQLQLEYASHVFGIAFRLTGTVFANLPSVEMVTVSGFTQRLDKTTGCISDDYLYSIKADRPTYTKINFSSLDKVDPVEAMRANFENICKMTATGVFKTIEPFQP